MQNSPKFFGSNNIYLVLLMALAVALSGIIGKSFYSKGEPREALVSQSMINSGDWILPSRYGDEFATKPPFSHWIAASFSRITGEHSELEARLPSLVLSLLSLAFLFSFIKKYSNSDLAGLSCILLITSIEWHRASITARVDMTLSAMTIISLFSLFTWEKNNFRKYPFWALVGITGAILSKGPIGLILPAGIIGAHYLLERRKLSEILIRCSTVFLPALALSSLWYFAAYNRGGELFLQTFMLENFSRFQGTMELGEDPHNHSAFYLYGTILLGMMPWTLVVAPAFLSNIFKNLNRDKISILKPQQLWNRFIALGSLDRFTLISIIFYLIFFSIPSSKRSVYLLPIYPFLAYFTARFSLSIISKEFKSLSFISNALIGLLLIFGMIIFTPILSWISLPADLLSTKANLEFSFYKNAIVSGIEELDGSLLPLGVLIALALGLAFRNRKIYDPSQITRAAFLMGIGLIIANTTVIKGITDKLSAKSWGSRLVNSIDTKIPAYTFKERNYGLNYYMNGKLRVAESITSVEIPSYIFVKNDKYDEFKESTKHLEVIEIESSPNPIERTKSSYGLYKIATPTIEIQ